MINIAFKPIFHNVLYSLVMSQHYSITIIIIQDCQADPLTNGYRMSESTNLVQVLFGLFQLKIHHFSQLFLIQQNIYWIHHISEFIMLVFLQGYHRKGSSL